MFAFLGPNGSGKSTLFRILSTLLKHQNGRVSFFGASIGEEPDLIRSLIGVVFQHPSLDIKLTVRENLMHQGHLYGLSGSVLRDRITAMLEKIGLLDRAPEMVEHLSGGMQRRVELGKGLLHHPKILLLDEPSTGLDPGARKDFGEYLKELRRTDGVTILLTTHILDEADMCDRIAILDEGMLVALGSPSELKRSIGGDIITLTANFPQAVADIIRARFALSPQIIGNTVRLERSNGHEFLPQLIQATGESVRSVTISKPTLEDVFIHKTGHQFWVEKPEGKKE